MRGRRWRARVESGRRFQRAVGAIGARALLFFFAHLCLRRQRRVRVQQARQARVSQQVRYPGRRVKGRRVQGGGRRGSVCRRRRRRCIGGGRSGTPTAVTPAGAGAAAAATAVLVVAAQQGPHPAGPLISGLRRLEGGGGGRERRGAGRPGARARPQGRGRRLGCHGEPSRQRERAARGQVSSRSWRRLAGSVGRCVCVRWRAPARWAPPGLPAR